MNQLLVVRIIWGAMLVGQLVFGAVVLLIARADNGEGTGAALPPAVFYSVAGALAVGLPVAFMLRAWRTNRQGQPPAFRDYVAGTVLGLGIIEGLTFVVLVLTLLTRQVLPFLPLAAVPLVAFLISFPRVPAAGLRIP